VHALKDTLGLTLAQQPFSWSSLGVDIRGRSRTLHISYRTSHQIREQAYQSLGPEVSDVDGNVEDRRRMVPVFNGPAPDIRSFESQAAENLTENRSNDGRDAERRMYFPDQRLLQCRQPVGLRLTRACKQRRPKVTAHRMISASNPAGSEPAVSSQVLSGDPPRVRP
jgi:hypothetical protein